MENSLQLSLGLYGVAAHKVYSFHWDSMELLHTKFTAFIGILWSCCTQSLGHIRPIVTNI